MTFFQILQSDEHVSITANGRIVQIRHAQVSDTGRYTCVATNVAGEDEKDFDVNIQGDLGWLPMYHPRLFCEFDGCYPAVIFCL